MTITQKLSKIKKSSNKSEFLLIKKQKLLSLLTYLIIISKCLINSQCGYDSKGELSSVWTFKEEICSYNGEIDCNLSNKTYIKCNCFDDYSDIDYNIKKIINNPIQCNYIKKRRFITLFLSIFIPFGFDYLYLERYIVFCVLFVMSSFTIFGNFIRIFNHNPNRKYFKNKINLFFFILGCIMAVFWMINLILVGTGVVTDGYNKKTADDLIYILNINIK